MSEESQKLEIERLQSIVDDAKIRLDDRQQRLDDQRAEIERLKLVAHETLEQLSVAIIAKAKVEHQLAEQRAEIEHLDGLADRLKADVVRLGGEGVELRHQLKNQQAEIERLKKALILKELPDYSYREELRTAAIVEQQAELEQARIQLAAHDKQNNCAEKVRK